MDELINKIKYLKNKEIFERIFDFKVEKAKQIFTEKLKENFKEGEEQNIYIFINKILKHETHFNIWRAKRREPKESKDIKTYDPFCNPLEETPVDNIGRLENEYAITASNLAKISSLHSLVIFKKHKKEELNFSDFLNGFDLALKWFELQNSQIKVLIFNYGLRAGASIEHPHFQIISLDEIPYKVKDFYEKIEKYNEEFNSNYLNDLFLVLEELDLARKLNNLNLIINLTPFKDKEIFFFDDKIENCKKEISLILSTYKEFSENFNLFLLESNKGLLGYIVDRGEKEKINSDIGALEIYAFSVVGFNLLEFAKDFILKLEEKELEFQNLT